MQGSGQQAAIFFGAANRVFQHIANTFSPPERDWREADLAAARKMIGNETFQHYWEEGFALTEEQVMEQFAIDQ
jgi:hypothetical protein